MASSESTTRVSGHVRGEGTRPGKIPSPDPNSKPETLMSSPYLPRLLNSYCPVNFYLWPVVIGQNIHPYEENWIFVLWALG